MGSVAVTVELRKRDRVRCTRQDSDTSTQMQQAARNQINARGLRPLAFILVDLFSDDANVLGAGTFWPLSNVERNALPLVQIVKVAAIACRHVEKHIFAVASLDESKTFISDSLNRTFSHNLTFFVSPLGP